MVIAVTLLSATVIVVVPVIAPEDAVMFAVPGTAPVTTPAALMGATEVSSEDQKTPELRVLVLPSSKFPTADICKVLPCWIVAFCGPTVIEFNCGSRKKPRHPTAKPSEKSVAIASRIWSFRFAVNMF
jgi:hypothetical protein